MSALKIGPWVKEKPTRVVFRMWQGEVIAFFPDLKEHNGNVLSYMRVGQHGAADYRGLVRESRLAEASEYASLKRELESIGYNLKIIKRVTK